MKIVAIVAMTDDRVIGNDGKIPWHIPEDLIRFRELTMGHPVLMGRKTFESIPEKFRPLHGRPNLVLTSDPGSLPEGVHGFTNLPAAIAFARTEVRTEVRTNSPGSTLWVAGGSAVYEQTVQLWDQLYLTRVREAEDGDRRFPHFEHEFQCQSQENHDGFTYEIYNRVYS